MQSGRLWKLFLDKSKFQSEDKLPRSIGIPSSDKLRPEIFISVKECNPEMEAGSKLTGFKLFCDIHDEKSDNQDFADCSLNPNNNRVFKFFKRPKEDGSCLIAVPSASNFVKAIIFPNSSGNLSTFKQPDKLKVSRDFKFEMLLGRFLKFLHPSKFSETSLSRFPMDS
jgi:hypothetical protein